MCDLSVGVYERGRASGFTSGFTKGRMENSNEIVMNLLQMHVGMDFIKKATGRSEEDIRKLAEEHHLPV